MKNKNLDELFREKLLNYEQDPPAYLLENILKGSAVDRNRRRFLIWKFAGVAAAVLIVFIAGWQFMNMNGGMHEPKIVVQQDPSTEVKKEVNVVPEKNLVPAKNQNTFVQTNVLPADTKSDLNLQVAALAKNKEMKSSSGSILNIRIDNSEIMNLVKAKSGRISTFQRFSNTLHEMKGYKTDENQQLLSFDQQIMEQNQQHLAGQNESRKDIRWIVGAQVSPAYNVTRSSHSTFYASNMLNPSSNTPVELGAGISVEYKPGKRWSLQSGVFYAGLSETSQNSSFINGKSNTLADRGAEYMNAPVTIDSKAKTMSINSSAGVIEISGIPSEIILGSSLDSKNIAPSVVVSDAQFTQNFQYIEIPLYLRYTILDAGFDIEMLGGFSSNVLVGNETLMESSNVKSLVGKTQDMQSMNFSGTIGLGFKYGLSKHIFLNVEPRIKYYLNSLNSSSSVTYKPYTFGVFSGISYQF